MFRSIGYWLYCTFIFMYGAPHIEGSTILYPWPTTAKNLSSQSESFFSEPVNKTQKPQKAVALAIVLDDVTINVGDTFQYKVIASFADKSIKNVTQECIWSSSNPKIAHISSSGLTRGKREGTAVITASFGKLNIQSTVTVSGKMTSIAIVPSTTTIGVGCAVNYHAIATYSNGTVKEITDSVKWSSSKSSTVSIDETGKAVGERNGSVHIKAFRKKISAQAKLEVKGNIVAIQVSPANLKIEQSVLQQYKAIATYDDGSTQDITSQVCWHSSKKEVATIDSYGLSLGIKEGETSIKAFFGSVMGHATLTVLPEKLTSISVSPTINNLVVYESQELLAIGTYSNGKTIDSDHGLSVTWSSANDDIVCMKQPGFALAKMAGSTEVFASSAVEKRVKGSAKVFVDAAKLIDITIKPETVTTNNYDTVLFEAKGHYSNGSTISTKHGFEVTWNVNDKTSATIDATGKATSIRPSRTPDIMAMAGFIGATATLNITPAELREIVITPSSEKMVPGQQKQFFATGMYSDGSSIDLTQAVIWTSNNQYVATISDVGGLAIAHSEGVASITATSGRVSSSVTVTVDHATLTEIKITANSTRLAKGMPCAFTAKAKYSDHTSADITQGVTWDSKDNDIMSVSDAIGTKGFAVAQGSGETSITATLGNVTGSAVVTVKSAEISTVILSPPSIIRHGQSQPIKATALYTDSTTADVTQTVIWTSSNNGIQITDSGVIKGLKLGQTANINAQLGGVNSNNTANTSVSNATITSLQIVPSSMTLSKGCQQPLTAQATYSDGTSADITDNVQWACDDQTVANTNDISLLQAHNGGNANLIASFSGSEGSASVTVSQATISSISLSPSPLSMYEGVTTNMKAFANYSDGTSADISNSAVWNANNGVIVREIYGGEIQAVTPGSNATVTASCEGISGTAIVNVVDSDMVWITVNPNPILMYVDGEQQCEAIATYRDKSTHDITAAAAWTSSDENIVVFNGKPGNVTGLAPADAEIYATYTTSEKIIVTGTSNVTVESQPANLIIKSPSPDLHVYFEQPLQAIISYADGTFKDVTYLTTWTSSNPDLVTVTDLGLITSKNNNTDGAQATITAFYEGMTATTTITLRILTKFSVTPSSISSYGGGTSFNLTAMGQYSDSTTVDVTQIVDWISGPDAEFTSPGVAYIYEFLLIDTEVTAINVQKDHHRLDTVVTLYMHPGTL